MLLNVIAAVVLIVWCANFVASLLIKEYDGSAINGIFTVVIGGILAMKSKSGRSDDEDEDDEADRKRPTDPTRSIE